MESMRRFTNNKYARFLVWFFLAIVIGVGILFAVAVTHHSDSLPTDTLSPVCAIAVQQIHYNTKSSGDDDCMIRHWYNDQIKNIPVILQQLQQQSVPVAERAVCAFSLRHQMRIEARTAMPSEFEVSVLRLRDLLSYGHFDGPEFLQLVGAHPVESDYWHVIASAIKTDMQVNQFCEKQ